jgi:hypothetical protein
VNAPTVGSKSIDKRVLVASVNITSSASSPSARPLKLDTSNAADVPSS